MLNQVILVGRIVNDTEVKETDGGKKFVSLTLAVQRSYKNTEGIYETDFIDCSLWNAIALNINEYCKKGDLVGIKGSLRTEKYVDKDGNNKISIKVNAEKVTFLSSKQPLEKSEER